MSPTLGLVAVERRGFPRLRGDEPAGTVRDALARKFSPPTRG